MNPSILLLMVIFPHVVTLPQFTYYSYILSVLPLLVVIRDMVNTTTLTLFAVLLACVRRLEYQSLYAALVFFAVFFGWIPPRCSSIFHSEESFWSCRSC